MSTAATATPSPAFPVYFMLRRLQSLAGILFGGYIVVHLLVNATLIQGRDPDVYQQQVDKIHSLPFLLGIEVTFIYLPILIHAVYGIYVALNGKPNTTHYGYAKNWIYLIQRVTGMLLVLFLLFHMGGMYGWFGQTLKFNPHEATETAIRHIHANPIIWLLIYPLGILFGTSHAANGFYTAAISWGLTVSKKAQDRWGYICVGIFLFMTACGFLTLIGTFTNHARLLPAIGS